MAYDEELAARVRVELKGTPGLSEKKMFGGIAWMVNGHVAVGASHDGRLMVRCSAADHDDYAAKPGAAAMVQKGRAMTGWILIDAEAVEDEVRLAEWVARGVSYATAMPPKG